MLDIRDEKDLITFILTESGRNFRTIAAQIRSMLHDSMNRAKEINDGK